MDDARPIFLQVAEKVENDIISGVLPEDSQIPSTNDFAAFLRINPATAGKGVNLLVDSGILYKKRGIGMFVSPGAKDQILAERRERFRADYILPIVAEAAKLGISPRDLAGMIDVADLGAVR
ncbi:GntR family transcriptional regulator [Xylanimonas protaetiae]|uniref:GntR family transcriptional regulator n=1 Tax=Xylanimonas protaetiae TaxID=2509457 RepID=A0A4P6F1Z5_9MICO|nr:GntR family transcriptional regulator [Xylanimonas protaetiae]QAY69542.1 GntR family transcriptional regulator [Xylanimonas protaetiae]